MRSRAAFTPRSGVLPWAALPGWQYDAPASLSLQDSDGPSREVPCFPMLWSGHGEEISGEVQLVGDQGIWGDSVVWRKAAVVRDGACVAYLHLRNHYGAAPQPLPAGSDLTVPHVVIGRDDADALIAELRRGPVEATVSVRVSRPSQSVGQNVVVRVPAAGTEWDETQPSVLVCAHYDTFFNTLGAYDNGSGTIELLHLLRGWNDQGPARQILGVFFTAEEWHLGGAQEFVRARSAEELDRISMVVNIDGIGRGNALELFTAPETFEAHARRQAERLLGHRFSITSRFPSTKGTDDAIFAMRGIPAFFLTINDQERLHTPLDVLDPEIAANAGQLEALIRVIAEETPVPDRFPAAAPL